MGRRKRGRPANPNPHGTNSGYCRGCRCEPCKEAARTHGIEYRNRLRNSPTPLRVHGTLNGYNTYGCRCDECYEAMQAYNFERSLSPRNIAARWALRASETPAERFERQLSEIL